MRNKDVGQAESVEGTPKRNHAVEDRQRNPVNDWGGLTRTNGEERHDQRKAQGARHFLAPELKNIASGIPHDIQLEERRDSPGGSTKPSKTKNGGRREKPSRYQSE